MHIYKWKVGRTHSLQGFWGPSHHRWSAGCYQSECHWRRCGWRLCPLLLCNQTLAQWCSSCDPDLQTALWARSGCSRLTGEHSWVWCAPNREGSRRSLGSCCRPRPACRERRHKCDGRCHGKDIAARSRRCWLCRHLFLWISASIMKHWADDWN